MLPLILHLTHKRTLTSSSLDLRNSIRLTIPASLRESIRRMNKAVHQVVKEYSSRRNGCVRSGSRVIS